MSAKALLPLILVILELPLSMSCSSGIFRPNNCQMMAYCSPDFSVRHCRHQACQQFNSQNKCVRYQWESLNQSQCAWVCCRKRIDALTEGEFNQCVGANTKEIAADIPTIIMYSIVASLLVLFAIWMYRVCNLKELFLKCCCEKEPEKVQRYSIKRKPIRIVAEWVKSEAKLHQPQQNCVICLQAGTNCQTKCRHWFHLLCLIAWLQRKDTCPNCVNPRVNSIKIICQGCHMNYVEVDPLGHTRKKIETLSTSIKRCPECVSRKHESTTSIINVRS